MVIKNIALASTVALGVSCSTLRESKFEETSNPAVLWADMTLYITKNTPANSPTYASRALGYIGLTMYESIVNGYPAQASVAQQLNGLGALPKPVAGLQYDWRVALNAGQAYIVKALYVQTSDENKAKLDSLEKRLFSIYSASVDQEIAERSVAYGRAVADIIFEWSKTDGGHRGYLQNFDKKLARDKFPGCWEPPLYGQSFSHYPLHPHWGENRNFLASNHQLQLPLMIAYDRGQASEYFNQHAAVYNQSLVLTQAQKEAALWWGDDPGETFTPPGHSYYLATLAIKKSNADMIKASETYARVGLAVADAFINCWKWKYHFYSERPSSFITRNVDEHWQSFWPDPPFPAFPSGHATQAAAVATVLADLYGENFEFTDDAHVGRPRDELRNVDFKARSFKTFWSVAEETASSRFYGGIHSPQDNEVGLQEGKKMGENVNNLPWQKNDSYAASN